MQLFKILNQDILKTKQSNNKNIFNILALPIKYFYKQ